MTLKEFHAMPFLLKRNEVLEITGWDKSTFYDKLKDGTLKAAPIPNATIVHIRKCDIAQLVGIPMSQL